MFTNLTSRIHRFLTEEEAATAVEYAVMLAVILIACIVAILKTGDVQAELWFNTSDRVDAVILDGPRL